MEEFKRLDECTTSATEPVAESVPADDTKLNTEPDQTAEINVEAERKIIHLDVGAGNFIPTKEDIEEIQNRFKGQVPNTNHDIALHLIDAQIDAHHHHIKTLNVLRKLIAA